MNRLSVAAAVIVAATIPLGAQAPADPSGHWEGTIQAPQKEIPFEIDLARDATGSLVGTLGMPAERVKGLPLAKVVVDGNSLQVSARSDQVIKGSISPDGQTFTGAFSVAEGSAPVTLRRSGPAMIEPIPALPRVGEDLEGPWVGVLDADGQKLHLVLTFSNGQDGSSSVKIVNEDQGGLAVPATALTRSGANVTLNFRAVSASFAGTLSPDGAELQGTYVQGPFSGPMTFRRK